MFALCLEYAIAAHIVTVAGFAVLLNREQRTNSITGRESPA